MKWYLLDTNICSFIVREQPIAVLHTLHERSTQKHKIAVSAITYAEMRFGAIGKNASPKHGWLVDEFVKRLDAVLPWDKAAVDATVGIKKTLAAAGTPIGGNDAAIAGHALSVGAILVTHNTREFRRVPDLVIEDWTQ
ncbi:MAG: type II toxin-antitoxin system VapC family toxin [Proteobacteria bacterium]|nr:type II toxin-antitoxin system VapC family toxin [Pseudomonadota bacterium]MCL2308550.1 type II toxin-antitoxin system VapC family toxin [Pseudomonadota bacterium]